MVSLGRPRKTGLRVLPCAAPSTDLGSIPDGVKIARVRIEDRKSKKYCYLSLDYLSAFQIANSTSGRVKEHVLSKQPHRQKMLS